jgi:hypothetical protein
MPRCRRHGERQGGHGGLNPRTEGARPDNIGCGKTGKAGGPRKPVLASAKASTTSGFIGSATRSGHPPGERRVRTLGDVAEYDRSGWIPDFAGTGDKVALKAVIPATAG